MSLYNNMMTERIGRLLSGTEQKFRPRNISESSVVWSSILCGGPRREFAKLTLSSYCWLVILLVGMVPPPIIGLYIPSSALVKSYFTKCLHFRSWKLDRGYSSRLAASSHSATMDWREFEGKVRHFYDHWTYFK